jgi:hypothetical protein
MRHGYSARGHGSAVPSPVLLKEIRLRHMPGSDPGEPRQNKAIGAPAVARGHQRSHAPIRRASTRLSAQRGVHSS